MKPMKHLLQFSLLLIVMINVCPAALAQGGPVGIAVIDMKAVFDRSAKFQEIAQQYEDSYRSHVQELRSKQEDISQQIEDLQSKAAMMEEAVLKERSAELERQIFEYKQEEMEARKQLDSEKEQALLPVIEELKGIVEEVAKAEGYSIILNKKYLVYVDPAFEITEQVIAQMNQ
mgnify:CR=1 FL=1